MSDFEQLQQYLSDPVEAQAKTEAREMWAVVNASELSAEDQAKREQMRPAVEAYLGGEIDRFEYEKRLAG